MQEDAVAPLVNSVVVPLILLSGIMLAMTLGPGSRVFVTENA